MGAMCVCHFMCWFLFADLDFTGKGCEYFPIVFLVKFLSRAQDYIQEPNCHVVQWSEFCLILLVCL